MRGSHASHAARNVPVSARICGGEFTLIFKLGLLILGFQTSYIPDLQVSTVVSDTPLLFGNISVPLFEMHCFLTDKTRHSFKSRYLR
jgi:hypothetical protein